MNRKARIYRPRRTNGESGSCFGGFLTIVAYSIFFFIVGGLSVNYLLVFGGTRMIPFPVAGAIGILVGPIVVTIAIVVYLLHTFHAI
jgi:hypothetical protein